MGIQHGTGNAYDALNQKLDELVKNSFTLRGKIKHEDLNTTTQTGMYIVLYSGYSGTLLVFKVGGSTGIVQFIKTGYNVTTHWQYRNAIDSNTNRWTEWQTIATTADINNHTPNAIKDFEDPTGNRKIQVGFVNTPLQSGHVRCLVGFNKDGTKLKGVTTEAARNLLGLTQKNIVDMIYPIGSVYLTMDGKNPKELFPGTKWKKISEGKYLAGVGVGRDVNKTLQGIGVGEGAGEYFHKLTINEMPSHHHNVEVCNDGNPDGKRDRSSGADCQYWNTQDNRTRVQYNVTPRTDYTGRGLAHNNMPPYFGVFVWQRTA